MEQKNIKLPENYEGRLLLENRSFELKESLYTYINRLKSINEFLVPAILYISAWETGKKEIWYEYAGDNFKDLFSCTINELPSIFRNSVTDRKTYIKNHNNVTIHTQNRELLLKKQFSIRNETENSGFNEAVYKIEHNNDIFWLKDQAFVRPFEKDGITVSIGNLTNVTKEMEADEERRKTEVQLKKKEKILTSLFNNSYDSVIVTDIEGTVIDCNDVAQKTFGASKAEILNKKYYDFIISEDKKKAVNQIKEILNKKTIRTEAVILTGDKKKLHVEVSIVRIDNDPPVVQAFIRDISERIALEKEKIKTSKFKLVSTMATGIAHDINNILSIILGHLEIMTKKFFRFSDIHTIAKTPVEIEPFLNNLTKKYDLKPVIKISDNLKFFNINTSILEPAFDAVLENAFEAMEDLDHKKLEINISKEKTEQNSSLKEKLIKEGNYIKIEIIDSGRGIKPELIERIFDPYFSTKPLSSKKGTGLGLTNAFTAVKQHDGYIEAESKENIMTKFTIYIPE
jgi:PAS domain S-box-containing protein